MIVTGSRWWFARVFVAAYVLCAVLTYAAYEVPPPRVNVRWDAQLGPAQRLASEARYRLAQSTYRGGTTWSYTLLDTSPGNIRALVQDPAVADTHHINRQTFQLVDPPHVPVGAVLALASVAAVAVTFGLAVLARRRQRIARWWHTMVGAERQAILPLPQCAGRAFVFLVATSYFYVLMEWLFFATKPSFMSHLANGEKWSLLVTTPLALVIAAAPFCLATIAVLALLRRVRPNSWSFEWTAFLAPAFIAAALAFLLVDTLTYARLGFSVGDTRGFSRYVYAAAFSAGVVLLAARFERRSRAVFWTRHLQALMVAAGVLLCGSIAVTAAKASSREPMQPITDVARPARLANVLILSTDGLDAEHMSAYGYARDTTPFLRTLAPECLVADNHLSNSDSTVGSIAALLTGALPTETRVLHSPDVLVGDHAFRHLPGVLRDWGYSNIDIGLRFFADAHDMNVRHAFHVGAGRQLESRAPFERVRPRLASDFYFLDQLQDRLGMRLEHAFGVEDYVDPLAWQNWNEQTMTDDESRIAELRRFLEESPRPFFAHVHLLGTHGRHFYPRVRRFSAGVEQREPWMTDFYDDAILQFDTYVAAVVETLKQLGDYDDTLLVINSDHGSMWAIDRRLPLLIRFPGLEHRGHVAANTQRIDIAPTIVDYLSGHVPAWMSGQSLIRAEPDPDRVIFSIASTEADGASASPPFYNLRAVQVAVSDRLYRLDLRTREIHTARLDGHTAPLDDREPPSPDAIRRIIVDHLRNNGYDVTSLDAS
jgi:hypothetical protein